MNSFYSKDQKGQNSTRLQTGNILSSTEKKVKRDTVLHVGRLVYLTIANIRDSILVTPTLSHGWATLPDNS
jgi:hypothetical protein